MVPSNCNCRKAISPLFAHDLFCDIRVTKPEVITEVLNHKTDLKVGNLVLLEEEKKQQYRWPMG